jgi:hypothetical protein
MRSIFDDFDIRALRVFSRGESFDADGFAELFSAAPVYQFGNAAPCLDGASIRRLSPHSSIWSRRSITT